MLPTDLAFSLQLHESLFTEVASKQTAQSRTIEEMETQIRALTVCTYLLIHALYFRTSVISSCEKMDELHILSDWMCRWTSKGRYEKLWCNGNQSLYARRKTCRQSVQRITEYVWSKSFCVTKFAPIKAETRICVCRWWVRISQSIVFKSSCKDLQLLLLNCRFCVIF